MSYLEELYKHMTPEKIAMFLVASRVFFKPFFIAWRKWISPFFLIKVTPTKKLINNKYYRLIGFLVDLVFSYKLPGVN